jgi:hypothetical protein
MNYREDHRRGTRSFTHAGARRTTDVPSCVFRGPAFELLEGHVPTIDTVDHEILAAESIEPRAAHRHLNPAQVRVNA